MSVKKTSLKNYEGMVLLRPDVEDSIKQVQMDKLRTLVAQDEGSSFEVTERGLQNNMYNIKGYPGRVPGTVGHLVHAGDD